MVRVIEYMDPVEKCSGYLVYDGTECRLAAGGCRMSPDLRVETLHTLANRMTLKQRVLGVNVDGAKCGIAYDPRGPERLPVLRRFVEFLQDELRTRFSMGCDMGTRFEELDRLAAATSAGSAKGAVRAAQGFSEAEFRTRMGLLDAPVGLLTVGERRAGHALAHAALRTMRHSGGSPDRQSVALQGFGNLGRAAALALLEEGVRISAVADAYGCVVDPGGLDIARMLSIDSRRPVPSLLADPMRLPKDALFDLPADVLILAGTQDAMTAEQAAVLPVPVVVVGANRGLSDTAEQLLTDRGVVVVPGFIGGIGGSASMEALFGPQTTPTPEGVLTTVATMMDELVGDVLTASHDRGVSVRQVGNDIAANAKVAPDERPYGFSPYRTATRRPSGNRGGRFTTTSTGGTR